MDRRAFGLILVAACSAAPREQPTGPVAPPSKAAAQALDDEWRRILEEAMRGPSLLEQENIARSQQLTAQAKAWLDKGDFERSREALQKALQLWPQNLDARRLLAEVNGVITGDARPDESSPLAEWRIRIEQALLEIGNHVRSGERHYGAREFEEAARQFEEADFKIRHMPCDVGALAEVHPRVTESLRKARAAAGR
jgi:tetratricopeptide (TPR) repeat protein